MSLTLPELRLPQRDELKAASVKFLGNVKSRFGPQSVRLLDVHKTLDFFNKGALSKKETHRAILDTLTGHDDLRQELMDILMHPAARWAPDDFDLPMQPPLNTTPQFLQPAHEPQMRLPTLSSWFPLPQQDQLTGFTIFDGYDGFSGQQPLALSPSPPATRPAQRLDPLAYPWAAEDSETSHTGPHDDRIMPLPVQTAFRNPWQEGPNYAAAWTIDDIGFQADVSNFGVHFDGQVPDLPFNDNFQVSSSYPQHAGPCATPTLLQQETPQSVSTPPATYSATPSPINQDFFHAAKLERLQPAGLRGPSAPSSRSHSASQTMDVEVETGKTSLEFRSRPVGELFIHALCGKGFATLAGVKKHHWGKKVNDLTTTTGCWAKYKKPHAEWDDHPSCKEGRSISAQTKVSVLHSKSPPASSIPQHHSIPGFPTLEHLPHTVAQTINAGSAAELGAQEPGAGHHRHRLASRSRFDSLLTAVNVVSQIEAPKPKGRVESIALHLDAQVSAAEEHNPFVYYESPTTSSTRPNYRLIVPAGLNTTASDGMEHHVPETTRLLGNYQCEGQPSVPPSVVSDSHITAATSQPFLPSLPLSSGPVRKKRKV